MRHAMPLLLIAALAAGCDLSGREEPTGYRTQAVDPSRDTETALRRNDEAVALIEKGKLDEAEAKLTAALDADVFFGPAHNNLGTVYYHQERYYLAAWEYQHAAKLMPKKAEPRNNLGMVLETVGRLDEAADAYEEAMELEPETVEPAANLARLYVCRNRKDERTRELLEQIVMNDPRPRWRDWARERLALMNSPSAPPAHPSDAEADEPSVE